MGENILRDIPPSIINFVMVTLFSLLIGLEQRRLHTKTELEPLFGTDRTFTLIGILGYVLYIIDPQRLMLFLGGGTAIALLLGIYYFQSIRTHQKFGITTVVIALITYCLGPLFCTQPYWLALLVVVVVLVLTEVKETLYEFSAKFDSDEFITLAKFLVIVGVVVPLLPDNPISPSINISLYRVALAVVAVSGISYFSYLLKKFVFPRSGILLTGILGGMYSSTATTVILARRSNEVQDNSKTVAAIILATTMMYIRLFLLALFFNTSVAVMLLVPFSICAAASAITAVYFLKFSKTTRLQTDSNQTVIARKNPLEIKTAFLFGALFILFSFITRFVTDKYGTNGINVLAFVVGVTDIDPFIINLFQGKWAVTDTVLAGATLNAVTSNNLLKMLYGVSLSDRSIRWQLVASFGVLIVLGLLLSFIILR